MRLPTAIQNLIDAFERLPGIGPKTAARLTFHLLPFPQEELDRFAAAVANLKKQTRLCSRCFNVDDRDPCRICASPGREQNKICVVERVLDLIAIEKSGAYKGVYHVLHGSISPLESIGPEDIYLRELISRLAGEGIEELIVATNPDMEGEATATYIRRMIDERGIRVKLTRIGRGLPVGGDLEYADPVTLAKALESRGEF
jgi:recombination protein RecR